MCRNRWRWITKYYSRALHTRITTWASYLSLCKCARLNILDKSYQITKKLYAIHDPKLAVRAAIVTFLLPGECALNCVISRHAPKTRLNSTNVEHMNSITVDTPNSVMSNPNRCSYIWIYTKYNPRWHASVNVSRSAGPLVDSY